MWLIIWLITETNDAIYGDDPGQRRKVMTAWGIALLFGIAVGAYIDQPPEPPPPPNKVDIIPYT